VSVRSALTCQAAAGLDRNGATRVKLNPDNLRVPDISKVTHIVSTTAEFPDYLDAIDSFVNVVKPSWVTDCLKSKRVLNPRLYSPDRALFMSNVTVYCSDIPDGDVEAIHTAVLALGGATTSVMNRSVTHIVALDSSQPVQVSAKNRLCAILPHW
jgi:hypothetical protein